MGISLFCFVFLSSLWKHNSIKVTSFKLMIQWVLTNVCTHETITTIKTRNIFITPKISLGLPLNYSLPPFPSPGNH